MKDRAIPIGLVLWVVGIASSHSKLTYFGLGWLTGATIVYGVIIWNRFYKQ